MSAWTGVLDRLDRQLRRQEAAFRAGGELPEIEIPEAPGVAMEPGELVRATDLMQRHDALITEALAVLRALRRSAPSPYA